MKCVGSTLEVIYGRVGATGTHKQYPISDYQSKLREKINKGYVDRSSIHEIEAAPANVNTPSSQYSDIPDYAIAQLVDRLQKLACCIVEHNYNISSDKVTDKMVFAAQKVLNDLIQVTNVNEFNRLLIELFGIIPRKMGRVSDYLAKSQQDMNLIVTKEQSLLDVMAGQVMQHQRTGPITPEKQQNIKKNMTILDAMGIEIKPVTAADIKKIKTKLGSCSTRFHDAWEVRNKTTEKKYNAFIKNNGVTHTDMLWHGSRNQNWWNIVNTGLLLRPTNVITSGNMFGYGTYFADRAMKSVGYTSLDGSRWANGNSRFGFMGLYNVALGNVCDIYSWRHELKSLDYHRLQQMQPGANSVFAHKGADLRNNEFIVYKEEQTTIKYLVELR